MLDKKMTAMLMTLSMLAAAFAGCLGGDDEPKWELTPADDISADIVTSAWDPIIPNLNGGEMCDAIISAMTKTDAREQEVDFTRGYYTSSQGVIGASGSAAISDVSDLNAAGTKVAVQTGTTSDLYAAENLGMATIVAYDDFPSVTAAVGNGEADYAMGDAPVLALSGSLMATFSDETFGIALPGTDDDDADRDTELLDALNVAITAIVDSGEYDSIFNDWFTGSVVLTDDRDADTATEYPSASEGSSLTAVLESGTLQFCSDTAYPPFENLDESGNAVGFDVDIANALVDEMAAHYMGSDNPEFQGRVKIGFLLDQTSPAISAYSANFMAAAQIAINDLNADGGNFDLVAADTGCNGDTAAGSASILASSGVIGVAGAACSGASMGANAVLSPLGIPMVSYASTSPALSDSTAYPNFWRVVPSDALQGPAMASMVVAVGMQGGAPDAATSMAAMNPALVHMSNDYGTGLAGAFEAAWLASSGQTALCAKISYDPADQTTDYVAIATQVDQAGCGSAVTVTYAADGAAFMESLRGIGSTIPAFGGDGIASDAWTTEFSAPAAAHMVFATKPRATTGSGTFAASCGAVDECASGIYTSETYDAITMIGKAYMMENGANMANHLNMLGDNYAGASGTVDFDAHGDIPGAGYDICMHAVISSTDVYLNCQHYWTADGGVEEYDFAGATVKIGFLLDLTSPYVSPYAPGFIAAQAIALQIMNVAGYSNGLQFEVIQADTACSEAGGQSGAQALVAAGVVGVVGAACSGASMGANSVLSPLGIPMISYASTSPALSDSEAYPTFWRVVPSDALQGQALAAAVTAGSSPAVLYMANDYATGLANAFNNSWAGAGEGLCSAGMISYDPASFDGTAIASQIVSAGCDSVVLASYAADGTQLISDLNTAGFTGAFYGGDGVADSAFPGPDGMVATKPSAGSGTPSERAQAFTVLCADVAECDGGIYTGETFDAFIVLGYSIFAQAGTPEIPLTSMVQAVGQGFVGATGDITFMTNGDVPGSGYCVGTFDSAGAFTCGQYWSPTGGLETASA